MKAAMRGLRPQKGDDMTEDTGFKKAIRARTAETGEKYTEARRALLAIARVRDAEVRPKFRDEADARDYEAWLKEGEEIARELKSQEEDFIGLLALEPSRAADAMVSLFKETVYRMENPVPVGDVTPDEEAALRAEEKASVARFSRRCDELVATIANHKTRLRPNSGS